MTLVVVFAITLVAFLLVICGMAVGVLVGRRAISGSCGGLANQTDANGETSCSLCTNPDAACSELGRRMQAGGRRNSHLATESCSAESECSESTQAAQSANCDPNCAKQDCSKVEMDTCKSN